MCVSPTENGTASHYMLGLAERVAQSGEVLNVAECLEVEKGSGGNIKSLLAMPIRNRHYQIIGKFIETCLTSFHAVTAAVVQTIVLWVVVQCRIINLFRRFGSMAFFLIEGTELCSRSYRSAKEKKLCRIYRNPTRFMFT